MPADQQHTWNADAKAVGGNGRGARRIPGGANKERSMSTDALALVLALLVILVLVARMRQQQGHRSPRGGRLTPVVPGLG
jgi:hypothetical protein